MIKQTKIKIKEKLKNITRTRKALESVSHELEKAVERNPTKPAFEPMAGEYVVEKIRKAANSIQKTFPLKKDYKDLVLLKDRRVIPEQKLSLTSARKLMVESIKFPLYLHNSDQRSVTTAMVETLENPSVISIPSPETGDILQFGDVDNQYQHFMHTYPGASSSDNAAKFSLAKALDDMPADSMEPNAYAWKRYELGMMP